MFSKLQKNKEKKRKHIHKGPLKIKLGFDYFPAAFVYMYMCGVWGFFWWELPIFNVFLSRPPPCNFQGQNTKQETSFLSNT